ncbi:B-lymphocyte antigen CD19 isoform X1 [Gopherus flavomarginatus]|uniref:B-lymphocyte antigen CD19 isoform X1 n=1 Tax=Gopherus flavomarginatus TaxID=286002 RepID=UPI0021CBA5ED|nr:B-lymphocyte antigen CD19 isoform X1 [Gopherus flavomarginatus]
MAQELHCLLLLTLLGWVAAAGIGGPPRQGETARRVSATELKAAVLPCGGTGALYGDPPTQLSLFWLWRGPRGQELLSLNVTLGEPPSRTRMGIGAQGSLVLPNVSTLDAGVYSCQWDGDSGGNVLLNVPGSREHYISGTQGGQVVLPCAAGNATAVDWFRDANNGTHQFHHAGPRHRPNSSALLIERLESGDAGQYRCQAGNQNWTVHLHLGGEPSFSVLAGDTARLPCSGSMPGVWVQGSLAWKRLDPGISWQQLVELTARRYGAYKFQLALGMGAALVLPAVTIDQAGTYLCVQGNHSHAVELEVTARTGGWQPWIVGAAAFGYVAIGLASLFGYYQIRRALQTRRRRKRLMDPARRFFKVTGNGAHTPYGNVLPLADTAGVRQTNAVPYENVALDARGQGRPVPAEGPISTVESEDEEEYEHPDSEEEPAPEDGDGYENTNGDMKLCMGDKGSSDGACYENSLEENRAGGNWASDAAHYTNARQGPGAEDQVSEDSECYENTEEDSAPLSPGAVRLVTDLRMLLLGACEEPERDRQDGHSEGSAGSQAYEEMAGALYAAPVRHLRLRDCSQEEDADSYENMEGGPGCVLPSWEGSVELRGDAAGLRAPGSVGAEPPRRGVPRSLTRD